MGNKIARKLKKAFPDTNRNFYEMKAGFYSYADPNYIYVEGTLPDVIRKEISEHETFHRTLSLSTIYGLTFIWLTDLLEKHRMSLGESKYIELLDFRNKMFEKMLWVQELGAMARAYSLLQAMHLPRDVDSFQEVRKQYYLRLTPRYRAVAFHYIEFVAELSLQSILVFCDVNDALAQFVMNPKALENISQFDIINDRQFQQLLCSDDVSPSRRLHGVIQSLSDSARKKIFQDHLKRELRKEFGICTSGLPEITRDLLKCALEDPDHYESEGRNCVARSLDSVIPNFACFFEEEYRRVIFIADWAFKFEDGVAMTIPDFPRTTKIEIVELTAKEQSELWHGGELTKYFYRTP